MTLQEMKDAQEYKSTLRHMTRMLVRERGEEYLMAALTCLDRKDFLNARSAAEKGLCVVSFPFVGHLEVTEQLQDVLFEIDDSCLTSPHFNFGATTSEFASTEN